MLLHGWGLNAQVWDCITPQLASHFTLHLVDLPGYGRSGGFGALSLAGMGQRGLGQGPPQAGGRGLGLFLLNKSPPTRPSLSSHLPLFL